MTEQYKRTPNTNCLNCKKAIYRRPCQIKGGQVFCSTACHGIASRKETPCTVCGKLLMASLNKKTCSRACSNIHRTGIKYKLNRPRDKVTTLRAIKLRLLEMRGKICGRCKYDKVEILQVHHRDRNKFNNVLENLELICPNCHYEEHFLKKSWLKKVG